MAFHERVLLELLDEPVVSSRSRRNPRGVKRKMSNYPLRKRDQPTNLRLEPVIVIVVEPRPHGKTRRKTHVEI